MERSIAGYVILKADIRDSTRLTSDLLKRGLNPASYFSLNFYEPLNLKRQYAQVTVRGVERVNGRDTYLVVGIPQGDKPESLYFDTHTGLLVRKQTALPTPIGDSPYQVDFDDYRDTGSGVKFPFLIHMSPSTPRTELAPEATLRVNTVKDNAPIEDAKFVKPATKVAPSR